MTATKNSELECLRFIFAFTIMSLHYAVISGNEPLLYFKFGHIGVEFFFILSGLLMAQSASKKIDQANLNNVGSLTQTFLIKKIKGFMPYLLIATIIPFIICYAGSMDGYEILKEIIKAVPDYLMLSQSGADTANLLFNGPFWYLSTMILGFLILYPLYLVINNIARKIIFPIIVFMCLGTLQIQFGDITEINSWVGFARAGLLRGLGEMALGIICYDLAMWLSAQKFTKIGKIMLTTLASFGIGITLTCAANITSYIPFISLVFMISLGVAIIYSQSCYHIKNNNRMCLLLGSLGLPLYLIHIPLLRIMTTLIGVNNTYNHTDLMMGVAIIVSYLMCITVKLYTKHRDDIRKLILVE